MKTAVIYARVSHEKSDVENSIQAQISSCKKYAEINGYSIYNIYTDEVISGKSSENRPAFKELIRDAKQKKFQVVMVDKLDRFSRSIIDTTVNMELLKKYGVTLCGINDVGQVDTAATKMIANVMSCINEFYIDNLAIEIKKGQKQNMRRGFHYGGKFPYGYRGVKVKEGDREKTKLELDPIEAPIIREIFERSASGQNSREIIKYLNSTPLKPRISSSWTKQYVLEILNNRLYVGERRYEDIICNIPALVNKELFELARQRRQKNIGVKNKRNIIYPLSGVSRCSECGGRIIAVTIRREDKYLYRYYKCHTNKNSNICSINSTVKASEIEEKIKEILIKEFSEYNINKAIKEIEEEEQKEKALEKVNSRALEKEIKNTQKQIDNIINGIALANLDPVIFKDKLQELIKKKEFLIEKLQEEKPEAIKKKKLQKELPKFSKAIEIATPEELKIIYKELIKVILNLKNKSGIIKIPCIHREINFFFV